METTECNEATFSSSGHWDSPPSLLLLGCMLKLLLVMMQVAVMAVAMVTRIFPHHRILPQLR